MAGESGWCSECHHASKKRSATFEVRITAMPLLLRDQAHSVATNKHVMDNISYPVAFLIPGQVPVIEINRNSPPGQRVDSRPTWPHLKQEWLCGDSYRFRRGSAGFGIWRKAASNPRGLPRLPRHKRSTQWARRTSRPSPAESATRPGPFMPLRPSVPSVECTV